MSERPSQAVLWDFLRGALMTKALAAVVDAGVPEALANGPRAVGELDGYWDTLQRLLRALASDGVFAEAGQPADMDLDGLAVGGSGVDGAADQHRIGAGLKRQGDVVRGSFLIHIGLAQFHGRHCRGASERHRRSQALQQGVCHLPACDLGRTAQGRGASGDGEAAQGVAALYGSGGRRQQYDHLTRGTGVAVEAINAIRQPPSNCMCVGNCFAGAYGDQR